MKRLTSLIAFIVALIYGYSEYIDIVKLSKTYTAQVIRVIDGDTIAVKSNNNRKVKIRLFGVDCPEKLQAFGSKATQFTHNLAYRKLVKITPIHSDRYGRQVAYVYLPDGKNLNYELVSSGLAWWSKKYAPEEFQLAVRELMAKLNTRGLWQEFNPIAPWDYRSYRKH